MRMVKRGEEPVVSKESVESQLVKLGFNFHSWVNRAEIRELPNILLPEEEIYECVNGYYEGGFALLVATNVRVLLIDKKPLNFLTVEDLRFDMINQMDYSHRMMGAQISISVGSKNLRFRSYNQARLRKLINHVQHCIAEIKRRQSDHQEGQNQHLEQINQQLQAYLLAQYQSQMEFSQRLHEAQAQGAGIAPPQPPVVKPSPELADYLYAQSLLRQHGQPADQAPSQHLQPQLEAAQAPGVPVLTPTATVQTAPARPAWSAGPAPADAQMADLYDEGRREVFGKLQPAAEVGVSQPFVSRQQVPDPKHAKGLEINALRIAYSKLPMALRNRKFGRPSFHAHSRARSGIAPI